MLIWIFGLSALPQMPVSPLTQRMAMSSQLECAFLTVGALNLVWSNYVLYIILLKWCDSFSTVGLLCNNDDKIKQQLPRMNCINFQLIVINFSSWAQNIFEEVSLTNVTLNSALKYPVLRKWRDGERARCSTGVQFVVHYKYQIPPVVKWLTCPRYISSTYITAATFFCRCYHTGAAFLASSCEKLCFYWVWYSFILDVRL